MAGEASVAGDKKILPNPQYKEESKWFQNKIRGGIAEATCRAHFEALGYAVEGVGIEHIAPGYAALNGLGSGHYISNIKELQNLPDFIISRTHPDVSAIRAKKQVGKADAVMVEAKFRTEVVLSEFTKEILGIYQNLIDKGIHFIVYLVCKRYKSKQGESTFHTDSHVFLNFINPKVTRTEGDTGWRKAGEWDKFETLPLYQGMQDRKNFNTVYREVVHPVLADILE